MATGGGDDIRIGGLYTEIYVRDGDLQSAAPRVTAAVQQMASAVAAVATASGVATSAITAMGAAAAVAVPGMNSTIAMGVQGLRTLGYEARQVGTDSVHVAEASVANVTRILSGMGVTARVIYGDLGELRKRDQLEERAYAEDRMRTARAVAGVRIAAERAASDATREAAAQQLAATEAAAAAATAQANAATTLSNRYAGAAVGIAMATDAMARQGDVGGRSTARMIRLASSMAFAFGPYGQVAGAIGITALAVYDLFHKIDKEHEKMIDRIEKRTEALRDKLLGPAATTQRDAQFIGAQIEQTNKDEARGRRTLATLDGPGAHYDESSTRAAANKQIEDAMQKRILLMRQLSAVVIEHREANATDMREEASGLATLITLHQALPAQIERAHQLETILKQKIDETTGSTKEALKERGAYASALKELEGAFTRQSSAADAAAISVQHVKDAFDGLKMKVEGLVAGNAAKEGDPLAAIRQKYDVEAQAVAKFIGDMDTLAAHGKTGAIREAAAQAAGDARKLGVVVATESVRALDDAKIAIAHKTADLVLEMTGNLAGTLQKALDDKTATLVKEGVDPEVLAQWVTFQKSVNDTKVLAAQLQTTLLELKTGPENATADMAALQVAIKKAADAVDAFRDAGVGDSDERIQTLLAKIAELSAAVARIGKETAATAEENVAHAKSFAANLEDALKVAYGLASALFGANSEMTKMVGAAVQVGSALKSIGDLKGGLSGAFSSGASFAAALPAFGQMLGGALAIGSVLSGLGAHTETPEEKAQIAALEANTTAIREMSNGLLSANPLSISGDKAKAIAGMATMDPHASVNLANFEKVGVTFADLQSAAKSLNLALTDPPTARQLFDLRDAIKEFGSVVFQTTAEGDIAKADALSQVDNLDALDTLRAKLFAVAKAVPALADALKDVNISSTEGRSAALARMIDLAHRLANGDETVDTGHLSRKEFFDTLMQSIAQLRALDPATLDPLHKWAADLALLQQKFTVLGTKAADQVPQLQAAIGASTLGPLIGQLVAGSGGDWKKAYQQYFTNAAADGTISDFEASVIAALKAVVDAMDAAAADAQTAANSATQSADQSRQASVDRVKAAVDNRTSFYGLQGNAAIGATLGGYSAISPAIAGLMGIDRSTPEGLAAFTKAVAALNDAAVAGAIPMDQLGKLTLPELIQVLFSLNAAAQQAASGISGATLTILAAVNQSVHDSGVLGLDPQSTLNAEVTTATTSSVGLASILKGVDLSTPDGRAGALVSLRNYWKQIRGNSSDAIDGQPGAEVIGTVEKLISDISGMASGDASGGGGGSSSRTKASASSVGLSTVTETQAFSLLDLGRSQLQAAQQGVALLAAILGAVGGSRGGGLQPPPGMGTIIPGGGGGSGAGGGIYFAPSVNYYGTVIVADAQAHAQEIADAILPLLSRAMGEGYQTSLQVKGVR